jgi:hypothetical protein
MVVGLAFVFVTRALKTAFTTAPILRYFNLELPYVVEADSSDYASSSILL